jgi:ribosomal protein L37AE/L43A
MFLNKQFENCPGQQYIAKKQYFFLGADAATNKLNSNVEIAWQAMARPGCQISMSIKMIAEQKDVSEAKCPSPGCKGRSVKIDDEETFSCQKCDLTYSMLPKHPAKEQSIKERRSMSRVYGLIPYWRRAQASETNQDIVGVDQQIACFKKVHILAPAMDEPSIVSTMSLGKSPLRSKKAKRRKVIWVWTCCGCGSGGMRITAANCPRCGLPRCPMCNTTRRELMS